MIQNINDLRLGDKEVVAVMVKSIANATTKTGKPYQQLTARDKYENEITIMNFADLLDITVPIVMAITVKVSEYNGSLSYTMEGAETISGASVSEYMPRPRIDAKATWDTIVGYINELPKILNNIVCKCITYRKTEFYKYPLRHVGFYSRQCGLMEATEKLVRLADKTAEVMNLDRNIMLAGALMYYLPNLNAVDETFSLNARNILVGPTDMVLMVSKACNELGIDVESENVALLIHSVLARFEGAVKAATPEAEALKYLDGVIQRTAQIENTIQNTEEGSLAVPPINVVRYYYRKNGGASDE